MLLLSHEEDVIANIFEEAQLNYACHSKLLSGLKDYIETSSSSPSVSSSSSSSSTFAAFLSAVKRALVISKREAAVERTVDFAAHVVARVFIRHDKGCLFVAFINALLSVIEAADKAVRFRVCQLIGKVISLIASDNDSNEECSMGREEGGGGEIPEELHDRILAALILRTHDKITTVRGAAVVALARLQDPDNDKCPVAAEYIRLLRADSSPEVRRAVINHIGVTTFTLPPLLVRVKDLTTTVRRQAFLALSEKVDMRSLSVAQRLYVLQSGLYDREGAVRSVAEDLVLRRWLRSTSDDVVELLRCLDVEDAPVIAELVVDIILRENPDILSKVAVPVMVNVDDLLALDCETCFLWRLLVQRAFQNREYAQLDRLSPPITDFLVAFHTLISRSRDICNENYSETCRFSLVFICIQLLEALMCLDLSEEACRRHTVKLTQSVLRDTSIDTALVPPLMALHHHVLNNTSEFVSDVVSIVKDIGVVSMSSYVSSRDASSNVTKAVDVLVDCAEDKERLLLKEQRRLMKREVKLASLRVQIMELKETLDNHVSNEHFVEAAAVQETMNDLEKRRLDVEETVNETKRIILELETAIISTSIEEGEENSFPGQVEHGEDSVTVVDNTTADVTLILRQFDIVVAFLSVLKPCGNTEESEIIEELSLGELLTTYVLPAVSSVSTRVRMVSLRALAHICLMSQTLARRHAPLFLQVCTVDVAEIRHFAAQASIDFATVYGTTIFADFGCSDSTLGNISAELVAVASAENILLELLDNEGTEELLSFAAEGIARLLFLDQIVAPVRAMIRLLILFFSPLSTVSEPKGRIHQSLAFFFPTFSMSSSAHRDVLVETVIPLLREFTQLSLESSSRPVSVTAIARYVAYLISGDDSRAHSRLARRICSEIISSETWIMETTNLATMLSFLDKACDDNDGSLYSLVEDVLAFTPTRSLKRILQKFQGKLEERTRINNNIIN